MSGWPGCCILCVQGLAQCPPTAQALAAASTERGPGGTRCAAFGRAGLVRPAPAPSRRLEAITALASGELSVRTCSSCLCARVDRCPRSARTGSPPCARSLQTVRSATPSRTASRAAAAARGRPPAARRRARPANEGEQPFLCLGYRLERACQCARRPSPGRPIRCSGAAGAAFLVL